ncbi:MAG: hypothetical protein ABI584_13125 [Acidobacteriota bacterium]
MKSSRLLTAALLFSTALRGEDIVRLLAVEEKAAYRPDETFVLEMVCASGMTDETMILSGPGAEVTNPLVKCPRARVEVHVPKDFVGLGVVSVLARRGELAGDIFSFRVRSGTPPVDLHINGTGAMVDPDECSTLSFDPHASGAQSVQFFAEQPDGTLFDLCKGADVRVTTDQPDSFRFTADGHACSITSRREGSFKLVASYGGLRKEFSCRAQNFGLERDAKPPATPGPEGPRIATADFKADPSRLERKGEVGECKLVEHWNTGYCYVFSRIQNRKVSEATDVLCGDLPALRERMMRAVQRGYCEPRPSRDPAVSVVAPAPSRKAGPPPAARELLRISIPAFRRDPRKLDGHPMDVGHCRLVEHRTTGYCYVYSLRGAGKVSEYTDVPCDDLAELRKRMSRAIEDGYCN